MKQINYKNVHYSFLDFNVLHSIFAQRAYFFNLYPNRPSCALRMKWQDDYIAGVPTCEVKVFNYE